MTEVRAAPVDWSRVNWATVDVRQLDYANMPPEARAAIARRIGEIRDAPTARRSRAGTPLPAAAGRDAGEHNRVFQIAANVLAGRRVLNEDGVAGRYTRAAIRDLQRDLLHDRRGDGVGGTRTYDAVARALVTPPQRPPRIARVEPDRPTARNRPEPSPLTRAEVARPVAPRASEPGPDARVIAALSEVDRGRRDEALRTGLRDLGSLPERDRPAAINRVADSILGATNPEDRITRARALLHEPGGAVTPEATQARNAVLAALGTQRPGGPAPMSAEERWRVANDLPLVDRIGAPVSRESLAALGETRPPVEVSARDLAARLADRPRASDAVQELGDLATAGGLHSARYGPTLDALATELRGRPDALPDTLANVGAHSPQLLRELAGRLYPGDEGARDAAVVAAHARAATRVPDAERGELVRDAAERIAELHADRPAFERALPQLRERFAGDPSALGALLRHGGLPADMARDLVAGTWERMPVPAQQAAAQWLIGAEPESVPESMRAMVRQRSDFSSGRVETADEVFALVAPGAGIGVGALRAGMARLLATRALPHASGTMGRYAMTGVGRHEMPRIVTAGRERLSALERAQYMEIQRGIARLMETNRDLAFQFRNQLNTWMRVNNRML